MKYRAYLFLAILLIQGCAYTQVSSYKDPEYRNNTFNSPIVFATFDNLDYRREIERNLVIQFSNIGIAAIESTNVFPPTRKLNQEEIISALSNSGGDSIVIITLKAGTLKKQQYEAKVLDIKTGNTAWIGTSQTNALDSGFTESMGLTAMFQSLASGIVSKLSSDGMYVSHKPTTK